MIMSIPTSAPFSTSRINHSIATMGVDHLMNLRWKIHESLYMVRDKQPILLSDVC